MEGWRSPQYQYVRSVIAVIALGQILALTLIYIPLLSMSSFFGNPTVSERHLWQPPRVQTVRTSVIVENGAARVIDLDTESADGLARAVASAPESLVTVVHETLLERRTLLVPFAIATGERVTIEGRVDQVEPARAAYTAWYTVRTCLPPESPTKVRPIWSGVAFHVLFAAAVAAFIRTLLRLPAARRAQRLSRGLCPRCSYDISARKPGEPRCPECGAALPLSP
jgi:hypothetical protein